MRRQAGGVGGEKGERRLCILAVFRQVEMHPADLVPGRVACLEKGRQRFLRGRQLRLHAGIDGRPQMQQDVAAQVFGTAHRRRSGDQGIEYRLVRRRHGDLACIGHRAQGGHMARREVAPPGPGAGQAGADFGGTQMNQPRAGAIREGGDQTCAQIGGERRRLGIIDGEQLPVRGQNGRDAVGYGVRHGAHILRQPGAWQSHAMRSAAHLLSGRCGLLHIEHLAS